MDVSGIREAGKALMDAYRRETTPAVKVTFQKSHSRKAGLYYIYANGTYVGMVIKGANRWTASVHGDDTVTTPMATRKEAVAAIMPAIRAELAARTHWDNATSEDRAVSAGDSPVYLASRKALIDAIAEAYPGEDAEKTYYDWTEHGETIAQTVKFNRDDRASWAAYQAELDAGEEAEAELDRVSPPPSPEAYETPEERDVTIDIARDPVLGFVVTMVAVYPEAKSPVGYTRQGTPFTVARGHYTDLAAARRMVDVMAAEFRSNPEKIWAAYTVTLTGLASLSSRVSEPEVRVREGGSFRAAVVASAPPVAVPAPSYRAAGFPSLDAAIGAGYGRR